MQQPIQQAMPQTLQQQEQLAAQQMQQQMMLCPVRVVYETQILVQPGDQIQPNQTLFINPQNPPPWAQNRQIQNPVIYVQQMPNNMIPTVPQHIDQNQLFLQQYQNYQQMMPQQIINQEQRVQLPNIIPQNMIQNFQANINTNVPNIQERIPQNYPIQNVAPNMQIQAQPQLNIVNNSIKREPTNMQIVQTSQQTQPNQRVEIKPGVYMNVGPQMNQQPVRPPPQVLTVNPIQNIPQTNANIQTMPTNVLPSRPIQTHSVGSQMSPPTFANPTNSQPLPRIRKVAPTTMNKVTNTNIGVRSVGQTYKPIQPRPLQIRNNAPYYQGTINMQTLQSKPMTSGSNTMNVKSTLPSMPSLHMNMPSPTPYVKPEENTRKRKSESPDEIHKKMAAIQVNITTPIKPVTVPNRTIEVGVNTTPIQRIEQKPNITLVPKPVQTSNVETQVAELKRISQLVENVQQAIQIDKTNVKTNVDIKDASNIEKDKLIRNTVYTQARGRVLTDKESLNIVNDNKTIPKSDMNQENKFPNDENQLPNDDAKVEIPDSIASMPSSEIFKSNKRDMHEASVSLNTANNKGMLPVDRSIKQEKEFVLTHVLDGIVIQESNIAFPIREPATRRFAQQNAQASEKKVVPKEFSDNKEEEEAKFKIPDNNMPMLSTDTNKEGEPKCDNSIEKTDDPFLSLEHMTVKSWSTDELSAHLTKHKWSETASMFMDHEIDGESLFLVSKTQLLTIGVKENHADMICSFTKS